MADDDVIWETKFTWADVEDRLDELSDELHNPDLTLEDLKPYRRDFAKAVAAACMGGGDWTYAFDDLITEIDLQQSRGNT